MSARALDICIYGAGAVGGSMAVRLAGTGARVTAVARGAHAEAIRRNGLTLISGDQRRTVQIHCPENLADIAPQDVLIVALKWPSVFEAAAKFSALLKPGGLIVFAMNSIPWWLADGFDETIKKRLRDALDPDGVLSRAIPAGCIVGAVVRSANEISEPGIVVNSGPAHNSLTLGMPDGLTPPLLEEFASALRTAGYGVTMTPTIREEIWIKNLLASSGGPVAALTGANLGQLVTSTETHEILAAIMNDGIAVGRALGFTITEDIEARLEGFRTRAVRPSMLQDFDLGRPAEIENSILAIAAMAKALGIAAPVTQTVATLVRMKKSQLLAGG